MLVLLQFGASYCAPCATLKPVVESVAQTFNVSLAYIDISENPALAKNLGVRNIPTVIALRDGTEVSRMVGVPGNARARLEAMIHTRIGITTP